MARCLLALGSNLGDRWSMLASVCGALATLPASQLLARSRWHRTAPIGGPGQQGEFLNGAVVLQTEMRPTQLIASLHAVESRLGRQRAIRWDARLVDIDLLLYDDQQIDLPRLTVPHPRMTFRRFVLEPAVEVAGSWRHPRDGWTLSRTLAHLDRSPCCVQLHAAQESLAPWLAAALCHRLGGTYDAHSRFGVCLRGISSTAGTLESVTVGGLPANPVIHIAAGPPTKGGALKLPAGEQTFWPSLMIVLEPDSPEELLARIGDKKEAGQKKKQKNISPNVQENLCLPAPGPKAIIRSSDPATVVADAFAVLCSAWPDLAGG